MMKKTIYLFAAVVLFGGCDRRIVHIPIKWATIPSGSYNMGSPTTENCREPGNFKETLHQVTLTRSFLVSVTETTQGQFEELMGYNPSSFINCGPDCPVERISWHEAAQYCNAVSTQQNLPLCYTCTGQSNNANCAPATAYAGNKFIICPGYRLPTEAEWEYACRAGTTTAYYSGAALNCGGFDGNASKIAWYTGNSGSTLHLAAQKEPNLWGLYDMSGSVWEWMHDWYQNDLGSTPVTDPTGPTTSTMGRMLRGGTAKTAAQHVRSASRYYYSPPKSRLELQGVRCVKTNL